MAAGPSVVHASVLKLFDGVLVWGPLLRILREGRRFRGHLDSPKQAIAFVFASAVLVALLMKWSPPTAILAPTPDCPLPAWSAPGTSIGRAAEGALIGATRSGPRPEEGMAQQGSTVPPSVACDPPAVREPSVVDGALRAFGTTFEATRALLKDLLPGLTVRLDPPDFTPFVMLLFTLLTGFAVSSVMKAARLLRPQLFDRLNEEVSPFETSQSVAAMGYGLGFFLACLFVGYAGAQFLAHDTGWHAGLGAAALLGALILCSLAFGWWLPHWLAAIHGISLRGFVLVNVMVELPIVVAVLAWLA